MPRWNVSVPVVGEVFVVVDAETEEEALDLGVDLAAKVIRGDPLPDGTSGEVLELEGVRHALEGNVFYGPTSEASAELA